MLTGGGTDDQCAKLAHGLQQLGQKVWVCGPAGREFSKVLQDRAIPFHSTPPEGPAKVRLIASAARFLRRERIQIIHAHHGRDYWPAILAAQLSGARPKIVLSRHLAKSPSSWASKRFLLRYCDALVAVSHAVAKILREGAAEPDSPEPERRWRPALSGDHSKIHVIHVGIDTEMFRPLASDALRRQWNLQSGNFVFAVVGGYNLPRGKGQREFLAAAARIYRKIDAARFLIIGRGNLEKVLRADIERLGLTGKAWLTPYSHDMPATMNAIDCLVHPAVGTEALGLVVCEAMACGKAVIASALDGIPEAFAAGNYGQLIRPDSIELLADAMLAWSQKPLLAWEARNQLHDRVEERFSLLACARNVLALYLSTHEQGRGRLGAASRNRRDRTGDEQSPPLFMVPMRGQKNVDASYEPIPRTLAFA
jgi:glycosyltransferase involved in cell wall biosynthesis